MGGGGVWLRILRYFFIYMMSKAIPGELSCRRTSLIKYHVALWVCQGHVHKTCVSCQLGRGGCHVLWKEITIVKIYRYVQLFMHRFVNRTEKNFIRLK